MTKQNNFSNCWIIDDQTKIIVSNLDAQQKLKEIESLL